MAMKMSMKFEGGKEVAAALREKPTRVQKAVLRDALETAANPLRRRMASMAPREPGPPDMADNMVISPVRVPKAADSTSAGVAVGPASDFFYARYQEFGTEHHPAQPFVRPAWDEGVYRALADIGKALWTALAAKGVSRAVTQAADIESEGPTL